MRASGKVGSEASGRERSPLPHLVRSGLYPLVLFTINIVVVWRLLFTEYLDQLASIEGAFISLATYIRLNWPTYGWFPMWYGGYPFPLAYQPALHYTVAAVSFITGHSPAASYHWVTAFTYSLAGVAFYYLARSLNLTPRVAFGAAAIYSLFSPSLLLLPLVRADVGGLWHARRLQTLVVYGEGPNNTGLMLGMFALALFHRALVKRTASATVIAAAVLALVPATNWPATVALLLGLVCYLMAMTKTDLLQSAGRIVLIGSIAAAFALPFALPSTISATFKNANIMGDGPTPGPSRWIMLATLMCLVVVARLLLKVGKAPLGFRYSVLYGLVLLAIVMSATFDIRIIPQPMRFHVAMEIPLVLISAFAAQWLLRNRSSWARPLTVAVIIFCCLQLYSYRKYARTIIRRLDTAKSIEYQESVWFDRSAHNQRVLVPGSTSFWMNVFTQTPQMVGCCEQSVVNPINTIAAYITSTGHDTSEQSADYSLLWMKAFAVDDFAIGGPHSREAYKSFQFPDRFRHRLPMVWSNGDDYIYKIPERSSGLARIVRPDDLVRHTPANGVDVIELRPFVAALDDPALPVASWRWRDPSTATIQANLKRSHVISVAVNYDRRWSARVEGKPVTVRPDGLGLIVVEPHCMGTCVIDLQWSAGAEPVVAWILCLSVLSVCMGWIVIEIRRKPPVREL